MSIPNIRNALEQALASISPAIDIVHENGERYEPQEGVPYCEAYLMLAEPSNPTVGEHFYQERGILQVNLQYPPLAGTLACAQQAELIRALFKRGAAFTDGGVTVQIDRTAEIGAGDQVEGRWKQIVRVRWHADIFTS
ncbi:phage tail terminator-like protein [Duganella violaceipulchra]|uniref:DUF4128 domain-containing protein n=1 Tax=Duganella violaceipulchra TaxID=2849652 RepID=A0AA41H7D9_9BURK|nr:phage tail terminator-like protein [Duganella violaceicalia]MBV6321900.1 DUF4128 domain-containing protein [Duganella violaceicalia]MCP2007106.1 hypothetical protein [Duganella violaceicalia]